MGMCKYSVLCYLQPCCWAGKNVSNAINNFQKCDMIKGNESDVGNVDFEILAKTGYKFLCFILFLALLNPS